MDNALSEYRSLCLAYCKLHQSHEEQKVRVRLLLEELTILRQRVSRELGKTDRLTRRLTAPQRGQLGLLHEPGTFGPMVRGLNPAAAKAEAPQQFHTGVREVTLPEFPEIFKTLKELKVQQIKILSMMDTLKKNLLSLGLLELRCRELLNSINKAMDAYAYEWRQIHRAIYPLGIISVCFKCLRQFWGRPHFSAQDIKGLALIGNLAGSITNMANSPVF